MSAVSSLFTAFCVTSVFIGALFMIAPEGNMSKSVKYVLSLAFLLSLVTVVSFGKSEQKIQVDNIENGISYEEISVVNARLVYSETLRQSGINFSFIEVFTDKNENGDIKIIKVVVKTEESEERVRSALSEVCKNIEVAVENE